MRSVGMSPLMVLGVGHEGVSLPAYPPYDDGDTEVGRDVVGQGLVVLPSRLWPLGR